MRSYSGSLQRQCERLGIFLLHSTIGIGGSSFADAMLLQACFFFGTVGAVVELVIERAVRKPGDR